MWNNFLKSYLKKKVGFLSSSTFLALGQVGNMAGSALLLAGVDGQVLG